MNCGEMQKLYMDCMSEISGEVEKALYPIVLKMTKKFALEIVNLKAKVKELEEEKSKLMNNQWESK